VLFVGARIGLELPRRSAGHIDSVNFTLRSPAGFLAGIGGYLSLAALRADVCSIDFAGKNLSWQ